MHPAYSVIFFTTASGAGYGLLAWLSLAQLGDALPAGRWLPFLALVLALALVTFGLVSSLLHLGRPERAFRAVTQWRSSWLSREGVTAIATYVPSGLLGLLWLTGIDTAWADLLAAASLLGAVATVWCTGMIYASLRTIRQWHHWSVPVVYLALAASTGALLWAFLLSLADSGDGGAWLIVLASSAIALALKLAYYAAIDRDPGRYTVQAALGFAPGATIDTLDPPHTMPNFVMREMGYEVGRRHALRLRRLSLACLFGVPVICALAGQLFPPALPVLLALAILSAAAGLIIERWLFFAEAEHVAMLYYGRQRA